MDWNISYAPYVSACEHDSGLEAEDGKFKEIKEMQCNILQNGEKGGMRFREATDQYFVQIIWKSLTQPTSLTQDSLPKRVIFQSEPRIERGLAY